MAKKVVGGVMIIQKNADARTHPRPPHLDALRLRRAIDTVDFQSFAIPLRIWLSASRWGEIAWIGGGFARGADGEERINAS